MDKPLFSQEKKIQSTKLKAEYIFISIGVSEKKESTLNKREIAFLLVFKTPVNNIEMHFSVS